MSAGSTQIRSSSAEYDYRNATAPGPGTWTIDPSHVPRPLARYVVPLLTEPFRVGFTSTLTRYGSMLSEVVYCPVLGFMYAQIRPLGAPPEAVGHPPREVFEQILATSPEHQQRLAAAEAVWAERLWRADLLEWDTVEKPRLAKLRDELDAVDLGGFDDAALLAHLERCTAAFQEGWVAHHTYNGAAMIPVGDYTVAAMRWTGQPPAGVLAALAGASPVSSGGGAELAALAQAVREHPDALALVGSSSEPGAILAGLIQRGGAVAAALNAYLAVARYLPIDTEDAIGTRTTTETPEFLLNRLRAALAAADAPHARTAADRVAADLRALVPEDSREQFDELLAEARLVYRLRDERAVHGDRGLGCVARRALLEIGSRLVARGRLSAAEHAVDLDAGEIPGLLSGESGPDIGEVEARVHWRENADYRLMPPIFGEPPGDPLPADWLPPAAARVHVALGFVIHSVLGDVGAEAAQSGNQVRGLPVGTGVAQGPARVLRGAHDLVRIQPGDVLVTTQTGPAFNAVLSLLAALVTDRGGVLSHAAIVAREIGLPAVVGCATATELIPDGAQVRVDGQAGTVTVLTSAG